MKVTSASYPGQIRRPTPLVRSEINGELLICVTHWGQSDATERIFQDISQSISSSVSDIEVTRAYDQNTSLPAEVNYLRVATLQCNQSIFRLYNKSEIKVGFELTLLLHHENKLSWLSCGQPQMWLSSRHRPWNLVATDLELSAELGEATPLPQRLLGLDPHCHFHCGQIQFFPGDRMLLVNHPRVPPLQSASTILTMDEIKSLLAGDDGQTSYWVSLVES
ncbi:MAG: hypothetical protein V4736_08855 [Bdellovibrionota bacterium]